LPSGAGSGISGFSEVKKALIAEAAEGIENAALYFRLYVFGITF
jgi:hypothetical protein